jgi:hypothetical protein
MTITFRPWGDRPSIYDHICRYIHPEVDALLPDVDPLPDEKPDSKYPQIRWSSGARDGVSVRHFGTKKQPNQVQNFRSVLERAAAQPREERLTELHNLVSDARVLEFLDDLLKVLDVKRYRDGLHDLAQWLVVNAPDRESVKLGVALLGVAGSEVDASLLQTIGRHDEFTLFAVVALVRTCSDWQSQLMELGNHVEGWGRIHIVDRLDGTTNPAIKHWLLRTGCYNTIMPEYSAYICATTGELLRALRAPSVDEELFIGAGIIISALISGGPAKEMSSYGDGVETVRLYLGHADRRSVDLRWLDDLEMIWRFLRPDDEPTRSDRMKDVNPEAAAKFREREALHRHRLQDLGWSTETKDELREVCRSILRKPEWLDAVNTGLQSEDERSFRRGLMGARLFHIDAWEQTFARVQSGNDGFWYHLVPTTPERMQRVVALMGSRIPENLFTDVDIPNPNYSLLTGAHAILESLRSHPGQGWTLIKVALEGNDLRSVRSAAEVLGAWGRDGWPPGAQALLDQTFDRVEDERIKTAIRLTLTGQEPGPSTFIFPFPAEHP